jgi:hypothetical protein
MCVTILLWILVKTFFTINGWGALIISGGIIVVVYLLTSFLLGLSREEREKVLGFIKTKLVKR